MMEKGDFGGWAGGNGYCTWDYGYIYINWDFVREKNGTGNSPAFDNKEEESV